MECGLSVVPLHMPWPTSRRRRRSGRSPVPVLQGEEGGDGTGWAERPKLSGLPFPPSALP